MVLAKRCRMVRTVEDSQRLLGNRRWPWLGKSGFNGRPRRDVGLHNVAAGSRLQHIWPVQRRKVDNADAFGGLSPAEQLQNKLNCYVSHISLAGSSVLRRSLSLSRARGGRKGSRDADSAKTYITTHEA